jgi:hypothetical protein
MSQRATYRLFGKDIDSDEIIPVEVETTAVDSSDEEEDSTIFKTIGWISAGLGAVALGLFVGRELRQRYKFNRRTPYDFYAHSGDEQDVDFGLGI